MARYKLTVRKKVHWLDLKRLVLHSLESFPEAMRHMELQSALRQMPKD